MCSAAEISATPFLASFPSSLTTSHQASKMEHPYGWVRTAIVKGDDLLACGSRKEEIRNEQRGWSSLDAF